MKFYTTKSKCGTGLPFMRPQLCMDIGNLASPAVYMVPCGHLLAH